MVRGVRTSYDIHDVQEAIIEYKLLEIGFNQGKVGHRELSYAARDVANIYYGLCLGNPYRQASREAGDEWYRKARYHGAKAGINIPAKPLVVGFLEYERNSRIARFVVKAALVAAVVLLIAVLHW